jgi:hypothetical protein
MLQGRQVDVAGVRLPAGAERAWRLGWREANAGIDDDGAV